MGGKGVGEHEGALTGPPPVYIFSSPDPGRSYHERLGWTSPLTLKTGFTLALKTGFTLVLKTRFTLALKTGFTAAPEKLVLANLFFVLT